MIDYHTFCQIKNLHENDKLTPQQIARKLRLTTKTVKKWIKKDRYEQRKPRIIDKILDPFEASIRQLLCEHEYTAVQIFQQLKEQGYSGSYSTVKNFVLRHRPTKKQAYLTLSFEPAHSAQVDFAYCGKIHVGNTVRRLSVFVMTLCYSRLMYLEFILSEKLEHFLMGHCNAFRYFGGTPKNIMVDNCKAAVLEHPRYNDVVVNPRYLDLANHYGFKIKACGVRKPYQKGRVESNIGYIKSNFLNGRTLSSLAAVNTQAKTWLKTIANVRIHGQTKRMPLELFDDEKSFLIPLGLNHYDCAITKEVRSNKLFRVHYDANRYSVPPEYASCHLTLYAYPDTIVLYHNGKLIARHSRCYERNKDIEDPSHPKQLLQQRENAREQKMLANFLSLSANAEIYYQNLKKKRLNPCQHIRKIMALTEIYGKERVIRALDDALEMDAFSSEYIANLLGQRAAVEPYLRALHLMRKKDYLQQEIPPVDMNAYDVDGHRRDETGDSDKTNPQSKSDQKNMDNKKGNEQ
jgi:transposase